jgi:hypothetical protein
MGTVSQTAAPTDDPNYTIAPLGARSNITPIKAVVVAVTGELSFAVGSIFVGLSKSGRPTPIVIRITCLRISCWGLPRRRDLRSYSYCSTAFMQAQKSALIRFLSSIPLFHRFMPCVPSTPLTKTRRVLDFAQLAGSHDSSFDVSAACNTALGHLNNGLPDASGQCVSVHSPIAFPCRVQRPAIHVA